MSIYQGGNASISQIRDGLINPNFTTPLYVSANSFTVAGDVTSWLRPGRGLVITFQTSGIKRCIATSLSYDSGTNKTTINVVGDSLVNETITSVLLSLSDMEAIIGYSKVRAYRSNSEQIVQSFTWTKVQLNAKNYDTQNEFDSTTNYRFTAKKSGYYLVIGNIFWESSVDQCYHGIYIRKNGNTVPVTDGSIRSPGSHSFAVKVSDVIYLATNDYLELWCFQNAGSNINIGIGSDLTFMVINRLPI